MGLKNRKGATGENIKPTEDLFPKTLFNYPIFCFKYLHRDFALHQCQKDEKISLIERLVRLSSMTWDQIRQSHRHGLGAEKISQDSIRAGKPPHITPDITFYAIRFDGMKPMVGYKSDFIFHIVYLDRDFSLYDHG